MKLLLQHILYATVGDCYLWAKPILCDCDDNFNLDPFKIEQKITSKTKAIVPVHWAGRPCDMNKICEIALRHNLFVVEEACHALQAEFYGERCGGIGDVGCFSFHPLKNLNVWGDGGINYQQRLFKWKNPIN